MFGESEICWKMYWYSCIESYISITLLSDPLPWTLVITVVVYVYVHVNYTVFRKNWMVHNLLLEIPYYLVNIAQRLDNTGLNMFWRASVDAVGDFVSPHTQTTPTAVYYALTSTYDSVVITKLRLLCYIPCVQCLPGIPVGVHESCTMGFHNF